MGRNINTDCLFYGAACEDRDHPFLVFQSLEEKYAYFWDFQEC